MIDVGTKIIETKRLILRKLELADASKVYQNWTSDDKVTKYVTWSTHQSIQETIEYINYKLTRYDEKYCYDWVVCIKDTNEPIGEIDAVKVSILNNQVVMGYCFGSKHWNKGYGTEALSAVIDYLFKEAKVDKVIAYHQVENTASGRVMQKSGMHLDATLENYMIDKTTKKRTGIVMYSIDRIK